MHKNIFFFKKIFLSWDYLESLCINTICSNNTQILMNDRINKKNAKIKNIFSAYNICTNIYYINTKAVIPQQQQASSNVVQMNNHQLMAALNNINPTFLDAVKSLSGVVGGGGGNGGGGASGAVMSTDMFSRR